MKKAGSLLLVLAVFLSLTSFVSAACSECGGFCDPPTCTGFTGVYCTAEQCYSKGDCSYSGLTQTNFQMSDCTDVYEQNQGDIIPITECTTLNVPNGKYILMNNLSSLETCLIVNADNIMIYGGAYVDTSPFWCFWSNCRTETFIRNFIDSPIAIDSNGRAFGENGKNLIIKDLVSSGDIVANGASGRTGSIPDIGGQGGNVTLINSEFRAITSDGGSNVVGGGNGGKIKLINSNVSVISSNGGMHWLSVTGYAIKPGNGGNIEITNSDFTGLSVSANGGYSSFNAAANGGILSIYNSSMQLSGSLIQFSLKKSNSGSDGYASMSNIRFYNDFGSVQFATIPGFSCNNYSLTSLISIADSSASVASELCPAINQPAIISLNGLSFPQGVTLLRDGQVPEPGSFQILNYGPPFTFWVSGFTNWTVSAPYCGDGDLSGYEKCDPGGDTDNFKAHGCIPPEEYGNCSCASSCYEPYTLLSLDDFGNEIKIHGCRNAELGGMSSVCSLLVNFSEDKANCYISLTSPVSSCIPNPEDSPSFSGEAILNTLTRNGVRVNETHDISGSFTDSTEYNDNFDIDINSNITSVSCSAENLSYTDPLTDETRSIYCNPVSESISHEILVIFLHGAKKPEDSVEIWTGTLRETLFSKFSGEDITFDSSFTYDWGVDNEITADRFGEHLKNISSNYKNIFIVTHSNGHYVLRASVLHSLGISPDGTTSSEDSELKNLYQNNVTVFSISPLLGGDLTQSMWAPETPEFFPIWAQRYPAGSYTQWLFSQDNVDYFNYLISNRYYVGLVAGDVHLNGVWSCVHHPIVCSIGDFFFGDFSAQYNLFNRAKPQTSNMVIYRRTNDISLPSSMPSTDISPEPNPNRHTKLLYDPEYIDKIITKIQETSGIPYVSPITGATILTGKVVESSSELNFSSANCSIERLDCLGYCWAPEQCGNYLQNQAEIEECTKMSASCSYACDILKDSCNFRNSECVIGETLMFDNVSYYCAENGTVEYKKEISESCKEDYECNSGICEDICKDSSTQCRDYDGYLGFQSSIFYESSIIFNRISYSDVCIDSNLLREYYCGLPWYLFGGDVAKSKIIDCEFGCEKGACINASGITSCSDGIMDGNETGVDCGGECASCLNETSDFPPEPDNPPLL